MEDGLHVLRRRGWNTVAQTTIGARFWVRQVAGLCRLYSREHGKPDVVHAHNALWAGVAAARYARGANSRFVVTEHSSAVLGGNVSAWARRMATSAYRSADAVVCVSRALQVSVLQGDGGIAPLVVPNTVDEEFFTLPPCPRRRVPFTFLAIGNLTRNKGFDLLMRAFASRFTGSSGIRLEIAGEGPEASNLRMLAQNLGLLPQVTFLGQLERTAVREAMWRANALVLASYRETFGVVLIEAMATGLPVIATRGGGPNDIVTPEVGVLLEPGSEAELGSAMVLVSEARHYGDQRIRDVAVKRFGFEAVASELVGIYRAVTGSSRAS